jgi:hypothetical protein
MRSSLPNVLPWGWDRGENGASSFSVNHHARCAPGQNHQKKWLDERRFSARVPRYLDRAFTVKSRIEVGGKRFALPPSEIGARTTIDLVDPAGPQRTLLQQRLCDTPTLPRGWS